MAPLDWSWQEKIFPGCKPRPRESLSTPLASAGSKQEEAALGANCALVSGFIVRRLPQHGSPAGWTAQFRQGRHVP